MYVNDMVTYDVDLENDLYLSEGPASSTELGGHCGPCRAHQAGDVPQVAGVTEGGAANVELGHGVAWGH